jgi:1,4-alpha-glucan branching enzyme
MHPSVRHDIPAFSQYDIFLFRAGNHFTLYDKLGSHVIRDDSFSGVRFAVWAPNAQSVSVVGDFNGWDPRAMPLAPRWDQSGVWEGAVGGVRPGALYKYRVVAKHGSARDKADPFAFRCEVPPRTASVVHEHVHEWRDDGWMTSRASRTSLEAPLSVYEVHIGSWRRVSDEGNRSLSYREMAPRLTEYVVANGFTAVEFLPVMEHPFYGSWGYQTLGYFAPSGRYGTPEDFMYLVDALHCAGIAVILDWVPSHFPVDPHGLSQFDGTCLYEYGDPREGFHPDWKSSIFNYGRNEVREFLVSSACFWCDRFHVDGIRVDAVASMLYRDFSRRPGAWIPNRYGGRENLEAISFLRTLSDTIAIRFPDVALFAEESTAWPMVTRPASVGGLGFRYKWNMGWMHDTLAYMARDPVHRRFHHNELTFGIWYAFAENFCLPLSHDEVVHCKGSLLGKMPGDEWRKFANLRLLLAYQYTQPGKKLLFMGGEFAQRAEWNHDAQLQWDLLKYAPHEGVRTLVSDLNRLYASLPALHRGDCHPWGFEWIDCSDTDQSVLSYLRKTEDDREVALAVLNFTPEPRIGYRVGVPSGGFWREVLNTDAGAYGGSGMGNMGGVVAEEIPFHGRGHSVSLTLPPLAAVVFLPVGGDGGEEKHS